MVLPDVHVIQKILLIAAVGAIVGLDRTALGQFMVSQPIVAAPFTGWILGDATAGLVIGALLEMIWLLDMPVGTFVPADSTIAAIVATAIAVLGSAEGTAPPGVMGFSILVTAVMAPVTMLADRIIRNQNTRFAVWALNAAVPDTEQRLVAAHLAGLAVFFLKFFLLLLVLITAGLGAVRLYSALPGTIHAAMTLFLRMLVLLGAALVVRKLSRFAVDRYVLFGAVSAVIAVFSLRFPPVTAVIIAAAAGWLGVRYRER